MPHDGSAADAIGVKEVSFTPRGRAAIAAGVEETAACAGMKELSDGVRFRSNVCALGVDAVDRSSGKEEACGSSIGTAEVVSWREDKSSYVGMRTWAACS